MIGVALSNFSGSPLFRVLYVTGENRRSLNKNTKGPKPVYSYFSFFPFSLSTSILLSLSSALQFPGGTAWIRYSSPYTLVIHSILIFFDLSLGSFIPSSSLEKKIHIPL